MAGRWIHGVDALINIDCLQSVAIFDYGMGDNKEYHLTAIYSGNGTGDAIDKFEKESDALTARDWFMKLLRGRIDIPDWDKGRIDTMFREGFRDR